MSVLECTAEKERDVFNVGLYTVHIEWEGDVSLEVNSRKGKECLCRRVQLGRRGMSELKCRAGKRGMSEVYSTV
jgi:hypothetical protein